MQATPFANYHPRIDDSELEDASGVNDFMEERGQPYVPIRTPFADVHMAKLTICSLTDQTLTQGESLVHETTPPVRLACVGMKQLDQH